MRRLWTALLVALASAWLCAAAPTLGQTAYCTNSGTTCTLSLTGLTNGSALLVGLNQTAADATSTFSISDGTNTYTQWSTGIVRSTGGSGDRACNFWLAENITTSAGALTPVITRTSMNALSYRGIAVEVAGAATSSSTDVQGGLAESSTGTSHPMVSPGITTQSDIFMLGVSAGNSTHATYAAATGFTSLTAGYSSTAATAQYISSSSARTTETATWTNTGNSTVDANCLIAIKSATSGGGSSGPPMGSLGLLGVGK